MKNMMRPWVYIALTFLAACGGSDQNSPTHFDALSIGPSISTQPQPASVSNGAIAIFSVTATGTGTLSYQWSKNGTVIPDSGSSTYSTTPVSDSDSGAFFSVVVSDSTGSTKSALAVLTVIPVVNVDVLTHHNDIARTGLNSHEVRLSPQTVSQTHFRKLGIYPTDGKMDAQPLVVSNLTVGGTVRNVLYAATEHDSVYAFDADTGTQLWKTSLIPAGSGETPSNAGGCGFVAPEIGITATPVVDRGRGAIYLISATLDGSGSTVYQRLHALSLTTGTEMFGGPTNIPTNFRGINQTFIAWQYLERSALLLANDRIYTSWSSHCDNVPYSSWVITFDASTLEVSQAFNGQLGSESGQGAFWNSGAGPAADSSGNVYVLSSNGMFDTTLDADGFPQFQDYGNSFIKLAAPTATSDTLSVKDYLTVFNTLDETAADQDLGSGGGMLLPDLTDEKGTIRHLMVGAGKDAHVYVVDRDNMGKFNPVNNSQIWQDLTNLFPQYGVFGAPAYFGGTVYYGPTGGPITALKIANAKLPTVPTSITALSFPYPGAAMSISANGNQDGIVWAIENSGTQGVLHAYDATDLSKELYNSAQAGSRDSLGPGSKYNPPTIANGKVYVTTQIDLTNNPNGLEEGVVVFGAF